MVRIAFCLRCHLQVLCGQEFPYAGLLEKVDQELLWKVVLQPVASCFMFSSIIAILVRRSTRYAKRIS